MSDNHPPGLWFTPGDAVLARRGSLILLGNTTENQFLDKLLDALATAASDGRGLSRLAEDTIKADNSWRTGEGEPGPAVIAISTAAEGTTTITLSGMAWAEITTVHGIQRLEAGQPSMLLRYVLGSTVFAVHGGLCATPLDVGTDRFSRLDAGTVRASGFTYYPQLAATQAGASATASSCQDEASIAADSAATPAMSTAAACGPGTVSTIAEPAAAEVRPAEARTAQDASADSEAASVGEPFEAMLLIGGEPSEAAARPALPLPAAQQDEQTGTGAPIVFGVQCANGHFDDPRARYCAVCGISMLQHTLVRGPGRRPPLGVLVLDDGAVVQLDQDYVIGREPTLDPSVSAGTARPLRTTDEAGTVSRVHARIQLDGWLVQVTDLGSTNGTRIRLPGQDLEQVLTPRIPAEIVPGSRVELGGTGLRYESHRGR